MGEPWWKRALWYATLPLFYLAYAALQLFEGLLWLIEYPQRSWLQVKEWLGWN